MNLNLAGKHLVVVGFWSDWGYLNDLVFATALTLRNAASVTVVNPGTRQALETKAPLLWETLNRLSQSFLHVEAYAEAFLDEVRTAFSEVWVRRFLENARQPAARMMSLASSLRWPRPPSLCCNRYQGMNFTIFGAMLRENVTRQQLRRRFLPSPQYKQLGSESGYQTPEQRENALGSIGTG